MRQERSPFVAIELVVTQTPDSTGNSLGSLRFYVTAVSDA